MPTFTPPTTQFQYPTGNRLMDRLRPDRGICVYSTDGGVTWQQAVYPYAGDIGHINALTGEQLYTEGIDYFLGGRQYEISQAIADQLAAAGFADRVTSIGDVYTNTYFGTY